MVKFAGSPLAPQTKDKRHLPRGSLRSPMFGLHPDLRRHNALVFVSSLVVGALGAFMIFAGAADLAAVREVPNWILIVFGAAFLILTFVGIVLFPRWYRAATRIVASGRSTAATVKLKKELDPEFTSLTARVQSGGSTKAARGEIPLLNPRWDIEPLLDSPLRVELYVDTDRSRVMAIATDRGLLWSIPHHRPRQ